VSYAVNEIFYTDQPAGFEVKSCTATLTRPRVVHKFRRGSGLLMGHLG
jgi:hypothetical protein